MGYPSEGNMWLAMILQGLGLFSLCVLADWYFSQNNRGKDHK